MLLPRQRVEVRDACLQLLTSGLVRGTSGNVSVRDQRSGHIAITPTGISYPTMTATDVVILDGDGGQLDSERKPTSELALHLAVYRARPEIMAVVHTHSIFATTFAVLGEALPGVHYLIARAGIEIPVAPYARYGTSELAQSCVTTLGDRAAVLLANHGVVAVGTDLTQAMAIAESVEYVAELAWRARAIGSPQVLDTAQLREARTAFADYGQQPTGQQPAGQQAMGQQLRHN